MTPQLRLRDRAPHLDDRLTTVRRGQDKYRVVLDRAGVQGQREFRGQANGDGGIALKKQAREVRTRVGWAAAAGGLQEPPVRGNASRDQRHGDRHVRRVCAASQLLERGAKGLLDGGAAPAIAVTDPHT